jgi:hypothetical protein
MVTAGRSPEVPTKPGFNGRTGIISKIVKDPRNPRVEIKGFTVRGQLFWRAPILA